MTPSRRKQVAEDTESRLRHAEAAAETLASQEERTGKQVSFSQRLLAGWKRVHERNNLAQLFHEEGRI